MTPPHDHARSAPRPNRIPAAAGMLFCIAIAAALTAPRALAAEEPAGSSALTIYSTAQPGAIPPELYRPVPQPGALVVPPPANAIPGYAVVRQEREIALPAGRGTIRFADVAALIDPTTVTFESLTDAAGTNVLEQNFQFDLVSTAKLMERYLDREITVEQVQGDKVETITGTLVSTSGGLVLRTADGGVQVVSGYANVRFGKLPGGLMTRPTLVWEIAARQPGPHRTRVSYQTGGMTWWADYNVVFAEGADANSGVLDVGAWVSIINRSGAGYGDARLKLIAGDVHRAPQPGTVTYSGAMAGADRAMAAEAGFEEKAFFEYHLYTLGRPTTLPDNSTKQIELFPTARDVPCEKVLVYYGLAAHYGFFGSPMVDRNFGVQVNKKVDIYLKFRNSEDNRMGMPLPSGRIRVSKLDPTDGSLEFIGEDTIDHTPKDEEVLIKLGSAFDVVGERRQMDFRIDTWRDWMEEDVEIKLRNHKDEPVRVIVKENLYRWVSWEIKQCTHPWEKADSRTIHIPVQIARDGEVTVRYTVHYSW